MDSAEKFELLRFLVDRGYQRDLIEFNESEQLEEFLDEIEERWNMFEEES